MLVGFAFQRFAGEIAAAPVPAEVLVRTGGLSQRNIISRVKITRDFIAAFADKAPYHISPGFLHAGIGSMSPASVCEMLEVFPDSCTSLARARFREATTTRSNTR